ncbi:MAG: phosphoribosylformylglycinamidine synthase subunit PurQ [Actinobacteria bacterium]|nr:phosphoribosylformylglycinamidine synthase subunit PurQ [Actinomycetota bacterium]NIS31963.1 phosphoribosylformylglycinamidine synthase subunit PurQ [Actinomycetota bacterium]NIT97922.1 phosphoribosylformylglycinamidine synthase subunit PurQ [Actinomycetota bacterium]NIU21566.1 phosphoribosylformylglycinamidine synthase subunit PurQ [Actinomycetota bacterium]NIU67046.1 phosphoribosylformylglycinamidine synthase subunit PurQ [Actinomycetota bacterium]
MTPRVAVIVFPGTNCEHDVVHALELLGADARLVFHKDTSLDGFAGVVLPGGFAHGDYLRTGAIARFSPIMSEVARFAEIGRPVLGICNGFQILCEAGLLPGALVANRDLRFVCRPIHLRVEDTGSVLTRSAAAGDVLEIPLNSYEGNYVADPEVLDELERTGGVILRYCDPDGAVSDAANPNGAARSIAGVARGSVAGLMPHPERAVEAILGSSDGLALLGSFVDSLTPSRV